MVSFIALLQPEFIAALMQVPPGRLSIFLCHYTRRVIIAVWYSEVIRFFAHQRITLATWRDHLTMVIHGIHFLHPSVKVGLHLHPLKSSTDNCFLPEVTAYT